MEFQYCKQPLEGRANKLYHYPCKVKRNNVLKKQRNEHRATELAKIDHNYLVLNTLMQEQDVASTELSTLNALGYDLYSISRVYIHEQTKYCFVFDYMYSLQEDRTDLIIFRVESESNFTDLIETQNDNL